MTTPSDTPIGPGAIAPRDAALMRRYAVAVAAAAAALLVRSILRDVFGPRVPFLQFYPAVVVASWYGGLGPGLVATGLSALASAYLLLPPAGLAAATPPINSRSPCSPAALRWWSGFR